MITVYRRSIWSGKVNSRQFPIDDQKYSDYKTGKIPLAEAFPSASEADVEFLTSGITADEWASVVGDDALCESIIAHPS